MKGRRKHINLRDATRTPRAKHLAMARRSERAVKRAIREGNLGQGRWA